MKKMHPPVQAGASFSYGSTLASLPSSRWTSPGPNPTIRTDGQSPRGQPSRWFSGYRRSRQSRHDNRQGSFAQTGYRPSGGLLSSEISGGERQLTLIARAITQQAGMLIMDEPTSSLDDGNQVRILKVISHLAKQGDSILMTSHFPSHAFMLCNKVLVMKRGRIIAAGSPEEIMAEESLSDYTALR